MTMEQRHDDLLWKIAVGALIALIISVFALALTVDEADATQGEFLDCGSQDWLYQSNSMDITFPGTWNANKFGRATVHAAVVWDSHTNVRTSAIANRLVPVEVRAAWAHEMPTGHSQANAVTEFTSVNGCRFTGVRITVNKDLGTYCCMAEDELKAIMTHELGHAFGLDHASVPANPWQVCAPDSIMAASHPSIYNSHCKWTTPRSVDIWNINSRYAPA